MELLNANPIIYTPSHRSVRPIGPKDMDDSIPDPVDAEEIYDLIRDINDPEHPLTLEQLGVLQLNHIQVDLVPIPLVQVDFTPTIPHCSMATLIGLCIRVKLLRSLPVHYKVDVRIRSGTHLSEATINRQLNDKERVAAATENTQLLAVVNQCLTPKRKPASCSS